MYIITCTYMYCTCTLYYRNISLLFKAFLMYSAAFFSNFGNYKSFGDTKFIPDLPMELLQRLIESSDAYTQNKRQDGVAVERSFRENVFS